MSAPGRSTGQRVMPRDRHDALIAAVYRSRGFTPLEAKAAAEMAGEAAWHGIHTHNGIKALHVEERCRAGGGGARPGATIRRIPGRFACASSVAAQLMPLTGSAMLDWPEQTHTSPIRMSLTAISPVEPLTVNDCGVLEAGCFSRLTDHLPSASAFAEAESLPRETATTSPGDAQPQT